MSKEMAVAFIEKARSDTSIQEKVIDLGSITNFDKFIELASGLGYPFSEQDFTSAAKDEAETMGLHIEEISELDLETVAGGLVTKPDGLGPVATITSGGTSVILPSGGIPNTGRAGYNVSGKK